MNAREMRLEKELAEVKEKIKNYEWQRESHNYYCAYSKSYCEECKHPNKENCSIRIQFDWIHSQLDKMLEMLDYNVLAANTPRANYTKIRTMLEELLK